MNITVAMLRRFLPDAHDVLALHARRQFDLQLLGQQLVKPRREPGDV